MVKYQEHGNRITIEMNKFFFDQSNETRHVVRYLYMVER